MKTKIADLLARKKRIIIKTAWTFALLLFLFLFFRDKKDMITIIALILIGAVSILYKLFITTGIGLELILFVTVVGGMRYGSGSGIAIGVHHMGSRDGLWCGGARILRAWITT